MIFASGRSSNLIQRRPIFKKNRRASRADLVKKQGFIRGLAEKGRFLFRRASRAGSQDLGREPGFDLIDWIPRSRSGGVACVLPCVLPDFSHLILKFDRIPPLPATAACVLADCAVF